MSFSEISEDDILKDESGDILCFFIVIIVCVVTVWYSLCAKAHIKNTSVRHSDVTRSFIMINMGTVIYFEVIPLTPSCCQKYSLARINPQLKIVLRK